jgi:hypothetical protein
LKVDVPVGRLFDSASIESLSGLLVEKLIPEQARPEGLPDTSGKDDVHVELI